MNASPQDLELMIANVDQAIILLEERLEILLRHRNHLRTELFRKKWPEGWELIIKVAAMKIRER